MSASVPISVEYRSYVSGDGPVEVPSVVKRTFNPIREIVDKMTPPTNLDKKLISLSIGDPTLYGNFEVCDSVVEAVNKSLANGKANGYPLSVGMKTARDAVAARVSSVLPPQFCVTGNDVILTNGCSEAISLAMNGLLEPGRDTLLIPCPGFAIYRTFGASKGIAVEEYKLDGENQWEVDLPSLRHQLELNKSIRAILINNPSNPTGSNYSKSHLLDLLKIAEEFKLTVIADEIYANMVFAGETFYSLGSLSENVPVLEVGGLAKQFMAPGWRLGWCVVHDRHGKLQQVRTGLQTLSTLTLGPCSLVQAAIPEIFSATPSSYFQKVNDLLEEHATILAQGLDGVPGLTVVHPQGTMYMMVRVDVDRLNVVDDTDFATQLLQQQAVFVLPGQCFGVKNYFRLVITPTKDLLNEACQRIKEFCSSIKRN